RGKHHILFFPRGNAGVVRHNGNWQDIPPNRLFCIKADAEFSVRCGEGAVDCFVIVFESGDFDRVAKNDYIIIRQDMRADFVAMNAELAASCLNDDHERSCHTLRRILKAIDQMTMTNHIAFAIRHVGPCTDVPDHFHSNEYQIEYFAAGAGGIRLEQHWMEFGPGSFCFIPPMVHHEIVHSQSPDTDNYSVKFQLPEDLRVKNPPYSPFMVNVVGEKQAEVLGTLKKIVGEYTMDLPISPESLNRLILLVHEIKEGEGGGGEENSLVNRAKRIVQAGYAGTLRVSAIAAQIGVSPEHLSRSFRQATGETLAEYINVCRLHSARAMLQSTALPIKQVAAACGFKSVHYFSNCFKKSFGSPPGELRRRAAAGR
ncbi:MAG: AraC family transcriptional regulator, partial [Candidatus Accumulibacter sp.]|nr:AraC family transcriptional regulator [Accumulibacter sp.]